MTRTVEVLDALMGSGKTHAIIDYMSKRQDRPWLYISPMLEEIDERIPKRALELNVPFYAPTEDEARTKSESCLIALKKGMNVCCTHNLMYKFSKEHIEAIRKNAYSIVSDEELNLINGYPAKKEDIDFLLSNNLISIDQSTGEVSFLDEDMSLEARYGDIKAKADLGMLYAARRSTQFMVAQMSPRIIDAAERFILLTYNYEGSIMQTFLQMHGYDYKKFDEVTLHRQNTDIKKSIKDRIELIETPKMRKIKKEFSLSKSWWMNATKAERKEVSNAIRSCLRASGKDKKEMFYTGAKDYCTPSKGFEVRHIGRDPEVDQNGDTIEMTRNFIPCNSRSTNAYADKTLAIHAYSLFCNQSVKAFIQDQGYTVDDDVYALNMMLQWLFRGCIRKDTQEKMVVGFLSNRMEKLLKDWLETP